MDRELNNGIIGYIVYIDESLREKGGVYVRGKEGFSLGMCSARALRASYPWVALGSPVPYSCITIYLGFT